VLDSDPFLHLFSYSWRMSSRLTVRIDLLQVAWHEVRRRIGIRLVDIQVSSYLLDHIACPNG